MPTTALSNAGTHFAYATTPPQTPDPGVPHTQSDASPHRAIIARGSRGQVEQHKDRAIKSLFQPDPKALMHEMNMWNDYLHTVGHGGEAYMERGQLSMPYIHGETPTHLEVKEGVQQLFNQGFMIGDPAPNNFKRTPEGQVVPVDFGQVFRPQNIHTLEPTVMGEIVRDYVKGGFRAIPESLQADYRDAIKAMVKKSGSNNPLKQMNVRQLARAGLL